VVTTKERNTVVILCVKGILEKFRHIGEQYNIKTVFKTTQTLCSMLIRTRPYREVQDMRQGIYSIPCECGTCYMREFRQTTWCTSRRTHEQLETGISGEIQVS
jgi:hypothetical protein